VKFRKKAIVIDAMQYTGTDTNVGELARWAGELGSEGGLPFEDKGDHLIIKTLEGDHRANMGDWIICGIKKEFYPCKNDIFEATYELVEAPEADNDKNS